MKKYEKTNSIMFENEHAYVHKEKPYSDWFLMLYWIQYFQYIWKPKQNYFLGK